MWGCWRPATMRISRRKRSEPIAADSSGRSIFTATGRSCRRSRARNTTDMPPSPSLRSIRYRPARAASSCEESLAASVTGTGGMRSAAALHWLERALGRPGVYLPGTGDLLLLVGDHLLPLREPSRGPAQREEHREVIGGVPHRLIDQAGVEVHVGVELPLDEVLVLESDPLELERDLQLRVQPGLLEDVVRHLLDQLGARVVRLVHPVPE